MRLQALWRRTASKKQEMWYKRKEYVAMEFEKVLQLRQSARKYLPKQILVFCIHRDTYPDKAYDLGKRI